MIRDWKLNIDIKTSDATPVYLQIAEAIIEAIKTRQLTQGLALPSSRTLAAQLKVNRNTVIKALELLVIEEWLTAEERKGYFVSNELPKEYATCNKIMEATVSQPISSKRLFTFDDGLPDTKIAPIEELAKVYRKILGRKARWKTLGVADSKGNNDLRKSIAQMLNLNRGLPFSSEHIFITRGSQMAAYLMAHCLLKKGDLVAVENPGYKPIWESMKTAGAEILPVPVDENGMDVDVLEQLLKSHSIKAIYVTPHHQFPTAVSLSLPRRLKLIKLSNQYDFTIIEDDYDHEFHFGVRPILPIGNLQAIKNYVYLGTFSKIVAPALRIGFLATSIDLIHKVTEMRKIIDGQGDVIMEEAVYQLIREGDIKRHIKRTIVLYKAKRDFFEKLLMKYLGEKVSFIKPEGGLAFWVVPKVSIDIFEIAKKLEAQGIGIITPDKFSFSAPIIGFRIGYASLSKQQLEDGIVALAKLL
ncbi:PLP-dependent aminotransferase family protein [Tamlana sp. 2_MG-2023]|uniref:MocR-like pyridoxine biosynthesis transcription factor PdxR n=1 Tax=unclassified Tamlana TaxID=2614803 RepID=UPI0026E1464F|nr:MULTISPECIES: PLP-dependent aminotransferase family protein [unclassified Tamlana]MDO6761737.1 PLP-dependent aminotransferase family protein [Tamlana sp. 2_MG-2023]MDO6792498.1 PLP-dependent aminotransferase family protein [Tamlana sp. 1_MG-2023]